MIKIYLILTIFILFNGCTLFQDQYPTASNKTSSFKARFPAGDSARPNFHELFSKNNISMSEFKNILSDQGSFIDSLVLTLFYKDQHVGGMELKPFGRFEGYDISIIDLGSKSLSRLRKTFQTYLYYAAAYLAWKNGRVLMTNYHHTTSAETQEVWAELEARGAAQQIHRNKWIFNNEVFEKNNYSRHLEKLVESP